jgi:hypothetical protein
MSDSTHPYWPLAYSLTNRQAGELWTQYVQAEQKDDRRG